MKTDRCDRMWQVEALDDGRLEPKDRASFERHISTCAACSSELLRSRTLGQIMSAAPRADRTDLERRRARIAMLGAANQRVVERVTPSRKIRIWALSAGIPLLGLSVAALAHYSSARVASGFEVLNIARADWSANKSGTTSRVTLRAGVASFHVEHVTKGAHFFVTLPDGEIEVRGTRFVVDVAKGKTRSVLVTEGLVALRLGGAEHLLHPGERWQGVSEATFPVAAATEPSERVLPGSIDAHVSPMGVGTAAASVNVGAVPVAANSRHASPRVASSASKAAPNMAVAAPTLSGNGPMAAVESTEVVSAGARFAEAVAAFGVGDYGRADALFGAFSRDFSTDTRAEDATFLRADARARRGDKAGAAAGARAYLRAYPNGLRRSAAERLAEDQ